MLHRSAKIVKWLLHRHRIALKDHLHWFKKFNIFNGPILYWQESVTDRFNNAVQLVILSAILSSPISELLSLSVLLLFYTLSAG